MKLVYLVMVFLGLPFSLIGAASQSIIFGTIFGSLLALGLDGLIPSKQCINKASING